MFDLYIAFAYHENVRFDQKYISSFPEGQEMLLDPNLVPRSPTVIRISSDIWASECDLGTRLA